MLGEFESMKRMIEEAIEKGDDRFNDSVNDWSYSWTLFHIIEAIDFYMQYTPDGFKWGQAAGLDYENMNDETVAQKKKLITREMLREYLDEIWPVVQEKVAKVKLDDMDEFKNVHKYTKSVYDKYLFTFRHAMLHLGELAKTLRDWNCERLKSYN